MAKYTKRVALIATSSSLTKEIEDIIVKTLENKSYSKALADIKALVKDKFDCRLFPITNVSDKEAFTKFAKEFGKVSPLIGALLEYNKEQEKIKRSGL